MATNDLPQRISEHVRHINELMSGETKSINRSGFWQSTALLLEGIAGINAAPDMEILAEASTRPRSRATIQSAPPAITLMDLQMPETSSIETIIGIRSEFPNARIIVLTTYAGDVQVKRAPRAGARGYLLKGLVHRELLETIRAVQTGQRRIPAEIAVELADHTGEGELTARETGGPRSAQVALELIL